MSVDDDIESALADRIDDLPGAPEEAAPPAKKEKKKGGDKGYIPGAILELSPEDSSDKNAVQANRIRESEVSIQAARASPVNQQSGFFGAAIRETDEEKAWHAKPLLEKIGLKKRKKLTPEEELAQEELRKKREKAREKKILKDISLGEQVTQDDKENGMLLAKSLFSKEELTRVRMLYGDDPPEFAEFYKTLSAEVDTGQDGFASHFIDVLSCTHWVFLFVFGFIEG